MAATNRRFSVMEEKHPFPVFPIGPSRRSNLIRNRCELVAKQDVRQKHIYGRENV